MVYNTGSKDDWDYFSKVTCDPDLTWDAMAKYRDLNQKYVPPNDGHDDVRGQSAIYSSFLSVPIDKPVPPISAQSQWDVTDQPSGLPRSYRCESPCSS